MKRVLLTGMSGSGKSSVEPVLRRAATAEIETTMPVDEVVTTVLRVVGERA